MSDASSTLVSVIIPTFNRAHLIRESIESVIAQTYKNWELIIVDDGSTDNTRDVVDEYKMLPLLYVRQEHTGKLGIVRNQGMKMAQGALIAFLDSDDLWIPEKLETQVTFLELNPDVNFIISNGERFGSDVIQPPDFRKDFKGNLFRQILINKKFCIYMPSLLFRRAVIEEIGYMDEHFYGGSDIDFFYRIAYHFDGAFSNKRLIKIRTHTGSTSKQLGVSAYFEMIEMLHNFRKRAWIEKTELRKLLTEIYYTLGLDFRKQNDQRSSRTMFLKCLESKPFYWKAWIRFLHSFIEFKRQ